MTADLIVGGPEKGRVGHEEGDHVERGNGGEDGYDQNPRAAKRQGTTRQTASLPKVNVARRQSAEIDFIADDPGLTLYHCHMQLHMDFGFMALMKYA